jgi:esterase/lipase
MNVAQFITGLLLIILSAGLYFVSRSRKSHASQLSQAQTLNLHQAAQGRFYGKSQSSIVADQPLLSFRSMQDHVVPPRNAEYILDHVNSRIKSVMTLERSYHCATIDYDRERIATGIDQFITQVREQQVWASFFSLRRAPPNPQP